MKSVQCSHCLCSLPETPYGCSGYSAVPVLLSCVRRSRAFGEATGCESARRKAVHPVDLGVSQQQNC